MDEAVKDAVERVVATFLQGFLGALTADQLLGLDGDALHAGLVAGVAGVLALVKTALKRRLGRLGHET